MWPRVKLNDRSHGQQDEEGIGPATIAQHMRPKLIACMTLIALGGSEGTPVGSPRATLVPAIRLARTKLARIIRSISRTFTIASGAKVRTRSYIAEYLGGG